MPKNLNTQLPATRNSARTAMHAIEATSATFARPARDTRSVSATNDGITASGLTIVTSVTNETRRTFDSGMNPLAYFDDFVGLHIDVLEHVRAGPAGDVRDGAAIPHDLGAIELHALLLGHAALVVAHDLASVLADQAIDA